jgi:hypothetical protein
MLIALEVKWLIQQPTKKEELSIDWSKKETHHNNFALISAVNFEPNNMHIAFSANTEQKCMTSF